MLVKRSLEAGLITGLALTVLAIVWTLLFVQLRPVFAATFAPVFVTGVCAVLRGGRAVSSARAALLAGAVAGLACAAMSFLGVSLAVIIQAAIPNWPYPGAPQGAPGGAFGLVSILSESPYYLPRERLLLDLPLLLPFPWPFARTLADGSTLSRVPVPWLWFFPVGAVGAALQAWLYYAIARQVRVGAQVVDGLARYRASFQSKLLLGFALLGGLIFAVGWLGFAALEDMHGNLHQGRLAQHWLDHTFSMENNLRQEEAALSRLANAADQAALDEVGASGKNVADELAHLKQVPAPVHSPTVVTATGLQPYARKKLPAVQEADARFSEFNQAAGRVVELYRGGNPAEAQTALLALRPLQESADAALWRLANDLNAEQVAWTAQMDDERHSQLPLMMLLVLLATGLAFPLGYVFSQVVVRPVAEVSGGLRRIGGGDFSSRVQVANRDELGELAERVNQMSEQLARLYREVETRTQELARSVEEQKALGEVSQAVNSTLDLQTVLTTIVAHAVELSGSDAGGIYEFEDSSGAFRLRATHQMSEELVAAIRESSIRLDDPVMGRAATSREPIQIADIREVQAFPMREVLERAGFRALLVVPLLREDRIVGALVVRRRAAGRFEQGTVELLQTFAAQSVLAIQNARLFQEIEDKSRQLEVVSRHKSEFLANMSHELRTPLNAIIGFSEVLLERMFGDLNEKQEEYLRDTLDSGQHLLSLINDILDLSRVEAGRMELEVGTFSLAEALENGLTMLKERASRHGIALSLEVDPEVGEIQADERKVKQVVFNLLSNAVKFTPDGGRVELSAHTVDGEVQVAVRDTGIGIAPEDQDRIFEEFRRVGSGPSQAEGTGLGLALTKKLVELHGGRIWVESSPGQGSTFSFSLPVRVEQAAGAT